MLQARGHYAASQEYLEQALGELSLLDPGDSSLKPLAGEILGAMRNNLPYSLSSGSSPELEYDGQAFLDSLDQTGQVGEADFGQDTVLMRKYREEAMLDSTVVFDLPVEINERVLSQLRIFKERVPAHFQRWLERKGRWEQEFTAKLAARGMPQDLIYLAMIESGFNARATSPAAATGIWQFIPSTGRRYGLRVDRFVDERRDPWKATDAALDFLSSLYLRFGDWKLAMAAYNCGEGCVDRAIRRSGSTDYWQLPIPVETRNYVPRVFAAAILGKRPEVHGFQYTPWQPLASDTFTVEGGITLLKIASIVGAPAESLALLNPALIKGVTPPAHEPWVLRLPTGTRAVFDSAYASLERSFQAPQPLRLAHRVRRGETLARIAAKYGVTVASLKSWNRIRGSKARVGRTLTVYADDLSTARLPAWQEPPMERRARIAARNASSEVPRHKVRRGETLARIAAKYDVSVADLMAWNDLASAKVKPGRSLMVAAPVDDPTLADIPRTQTAVAAPVEADESPRTPVATEIARHKVRRGETLQRIARTYDVTVRELMEANHLPSGHVKAGTTLKIPRQGATERVADAETPAPTERHTRSSNALAASHRVRRGETLSTIALKYGITSRELMAANGLRGPHLRAGQSLRIPGVRTDDRSAESTGRPTVSRREGSASSLRNDMASAAKPQPEVADRTARTIRYTVRPGDTLYSIARARSTTVDTLKLLNGLSKANLRVGQIIKVPREG